MCTYEYQIYEWVLKHIWMSHGTHMNESCLVKQVTASSLRVRWNPVVPWQQSGGTVSLYTLQLTATHCNSLQHTATHCNTPQQSGGTVSLYTLQLTATHCYILQRTATPCNTLQHTATHCNTLQHSAAKWRHGSPLHTATHCSILKYWSKVEALYPSTNCIPM